MVVPVIKEPVKNKELLIEVDSIVTDPKDLANVSLSSNDSLSKSRRKWRLIKIINKLNPALAEKKYQFPRAFKFFLAWLFILLITLIIYWSVAPRAMANSKHDCASSKSLKSSSKIESTLPTLPPVVPPEPAVVPLVSSKIIPKINFIPPMKGIVGIETSDGESLSASDLTLPDKFEYEGGTMYDEEVPLFDLPEDLDSAEFTFNFPDSFSDLSDSFSLRSSDVHPELLLASVDKFINFFKSMINF